MTTTLDDRVEFYLAISPQNIPGNVVLGSISPFSKKRTRVSRIKIFAFEGDAIETKAAKCKTTIIQSYIEYIAHLYLMNKFDSVRGRDFTREVSLKFDLLALGTRCTDRRIQRDRNQHINISIRRV